MSYAILETFNHEQSILCIKIQQVYYILCVEFTMKYDIHHTDNESSTYKRIVL